MLSQCLACPFRCQFLPQACFPLSAFFINVLWNLTHLCYPLSPATFVELKVAQLSPLKEGGAMGHRV